MVVRFAKRHFCGGFLDGKMTKLNGNTEDFFLVGPVDVLEVCDNERDMLRKELGSKCVGKRTRKGNKDSKEWWNRRTTSRFHTG